MSKLVLIPTPISEEHPLEPVALELLKENALNEDVMILVEEHKVARRRWLNWGLPREAIERFVLFNEHSVKKMSPEILKFLKGHKQVFLLSDCGLPAFCDPGQNLVDLCHQKKITVTATPFPNSISLAVALSGFSHSRFIFCGFIPVKGPERNQWMKAQLKLPETLIWMETPYRLRKLLEELAELKTKRHIFLAMDLGTPQEKLLRGPVLELLSEVSSGEKREFVMVLAPLGQTIVRE